MDDLDIGHEIADAFGLEVDDTNSAEECLGEERLGSSSLMSNFGATLLLGSLVFSIIVLAIVIAIQISKRVNLSDK